MHSVLYTVVQVVKGDLTKQQVTGIVNPTNTHLARGGASGHIAKAAGHGFAKNCDAVLAGQGSLAEGSSVVTQAGGALLCCYIIHAAGPHYSGKVSAVTAFSDVFHFHPLMSCLPAYLSACLLAYLPYMCLRRNMTLHSWPASRSSCSWTLINMLLSSNLHTCKGKSQAVCLYG